MSAHGQYRRALRNSALWLFGWPAVVWLVSILSRGEIPDVVMAVALIMGALNCASCAFDAGRLSVDRWRA